MINHSLNDNLIEIELDYRALEFVREWLTNATGVARWVEEQKELPDGSTVKMSVPKDVRRDSLAHHLLRRGDLADGRIITYAPQDSPEDSLYQFREGGKLKIDPATIVYQEGGRLEPIPNTNSWLIAIVQGHLRGGPDRVCVFEDSMSSPSDAWIAGSRLRPQVFENVVYFALFNRDAEDKQKVENTIRHTKNVWLFYGVMSSLPEEMHLDPEGGPINSDVLEMLARRAEKIVVGAYDGESYLIWSKPGTWMDARAVSAK